MMDAVRSWRVTESLYFLALTSIANGLIIRSGSMLYDTLLSANKKVMLHNIAIPPFIEPEAHLNLVKAVYDDEGKFLRFNRCGQFRFTAYLKAKLESGDWKEKPEWHNE